MLADRPAITYTDNTLHVRTADSYFDIPVSSISAGVFQAWAMPGDVNTDGQVGIGDIVAITNFMAGNTGGMTEAQADVNYRIKVLKDRIANLETKIENLKK